MHGLLRQKAFSFFFSFEEALQDLVDIRTQQQCKLIFRFRGSCFLTSFVEASFLTSQADVSTALCAVIGGVYNVLFKKCALAPSIIAIFVAQQQQPSRINLEIRS